MENVTMYNGKRYSEVKRGANVGELVKVVGKDGGIHHAYQIGEICIAGESEDGDTTLTPVSHKRKYYNGYQQWVPEDDYVVLELIDDSGDFGGTEAV